jgi:hypothetical protein
MSIIKKIKRLFCKNNNYAPSQITYKRAIDVYVKAVERYAGSPGLIKIEIDSDPVYNYRIVFYITSNFRTIPSQAINGVPLYFKDFSNHYFVEKSIFDEEVNNIREGRGLNRDFFPDEEKGELAKRMWNQANFIYGMEYGFLLAKRYLND